MVLVFTKGENGIEYVTGITEQLRDAVTQAGYGHAEYTGSLKEFERFCNGKAQVMIASRPIVVGKDGLSLSRKSGFEKAEDVGTPIIKELTQEAREYVNNPEQISTN